MIIDWTTGAYTPLTLYANRGFVRTYNATVVEASRRRRIPAFSDSRIQMVQSADDRRLLPQSTDDRRAIAIDDVS